MALETWLPRAREISGGLQTGADLCKAWDVLLRFIWEHEYAGACHDTSAVLYMLLSELGLSPTLNIGEVRARAGIFDHSWVEVENLVFDAAVCLPQAGGAHVGGPVFADVDLNTNRKTDLRYGIASGQGFGVEALPAVSCNLAEYATIQPEPNSWTLTVAFGGRIGLDLTFAGVKQKYGSIKRIVRQKQ